jgi:hypothetical protein
VLGHRRAAAAVGTVGLEPTNVGRFKRPADAN